jgi:hypothetical protein
LGLSHYQIWRLLKRLTLHGMWPSGHSWSRF